MVFVHMASAVVFATDRLQKSSSSFVHFAVEMRTLSADLKVAADDENLTEEQKEDAKQVLEVFEKRMAKNFAYDGVKVFELLDPANHANRRKWTHEQTETRLDIAEKYAVMYAKSRGLVEEDDQSVDEIAEKIYQSMCGHLTTPPASRDQSYDEYWQLRWRDGVLATFARALGASSHSEATVERHFKKLKSILCKQRASLTSTKADDTVFVAVNHCELYPQYFTNSEDQRKRSQASQKRTMDLHRQLFGSS